MAGFAIRKNNEWQAIIKVKWIGKFVLLECSEAVTMSELFFGT
jgi:hypothetical protein